jgi:hypothetical protein
MSQFVSDDLFTRARNVQKSLISNNIARAMNLVLGQTILIKLREENGQSPEEVKQSLPFRQTVRLNCSFRSPLTPSSESFAEVIGENGNAFSFN